MTTRWQDKTPGDVIVVEFDFAKQATSVSSPTMTIDVVVGEDPDPDLMLVGSPTVSGAKVLQRIRDGLAGRDYVLKCSAASGSNVFTIDAILPVRDRPTAVSATPVYLTEAEFEQRFGQRETSELLAEANSFVRAENDAAGLIDGYLAGRYALPLVNVPSMVKGWAADIARFRLWDQQAPEEVRRRYEDAIGQLKDLAAGRISLPPGSDSSPAPDETLAYSGFSAERVFTAETLKGF